MSASARPSSAIGVLLDAVGVPTLNPSVQLLVLAELPDIDAAGDAELAAALGFADGSAAGCRFRISGPSPNGGGRRILTCWDSREAFERWRDERLAAVLQSTGMPVPKFEVWETDSIYGL